MKNEDDILTMYNFVRDLGYTGVDDKKLNRKTFFRTEILNRMEIEQK